MLRMTTCCSPISCLPCCLVWRETQRTRWCPDRSTALWYEGSWARSIRTRIRIWNSSGSLLFCNNSEIRKQGITSRGKPKLSKPFFLDFFAQRVTVDHFSRTQASPEEPLECIAPYLSALNTYYFTCYETTVKLWATGYTHTARALHFKYEGRQLSFKDWLWGWDLNLSASPLPCFCAK